MAMRVPRKQNLRADLPKPQRLLTGREDASLDAATAAATEGYAKFAEIKLFW